MTKRTTSISLVLAISGIACANDWFASSVVSSSGLGSGVYSDPAAALGAPSTWIQDLVNGGTSQRVATSVVYGAWGTDPSGSKSVVTIQPGGQLIVAFSQPIVDDPRNWYGFDFIVFGNSFLSNSGTTIGWATDMDLVRILSSGHLFEPTEVSVSPDLIQWYSYPVSNYQCGDALWPTQAFTWSSSAKSWAGANDATKPVPPTLTLPQWVGKSASQLIAAYQGSAGGCAFDLRPSGFRSVRYIRFSGTGGEIDAVSRVGHALVPATPTPQQPVQGGRVLP
ncbi:MAG: hypothetical protein JST40_04160 [Armatimonadetes bacterium]|nr:hypothetical protein [Armatimonadota bacterium]